MAKQMFRQVTQYLLILITIISPNVISSSSGVPKIDLENDPWVGDGTRRTFTVLKLVCTAPYSISWEFTPSELTIFNENSTVSTADNYIFIETLEVHYFEPRYDSETGSSYGRSGNYTCRSTLNSTLSTSVYVYSKDNERIFNVPLMQSTYSRLVNGTAWSIPCPANLENKYLNVSLFSVGEERLANDTSPNSLLYPGSDSIRYDSRYGFLLVRTEKDWLIRPSGRYMCQVSIISNDGLIHTESVTVNIETLNVYPKSKFVTYTNKKEITVTCQYDEEVYINTDYSFMLAKKHPHQHSKVENFNWSVTYVFQENVGLEIQNRREGEISCRIKTSDVILHTWKHNWDRACNNYSIENFAREGNMYGSSDWPISILKLHNNGNSTMILKGNRCVTRGKCDLASKYFEKINEMELSVTDVLQGKDISYDFNPYIRTSMVFKCIVDGNYSTIITATPGITEGRTDYLGLTITRREKYDIFYGDRVELTCQADVYFYRRGLQWKLIYKNGTAFKQNRLKDVGYSEESIAEIFSFNTADRNVIAVACMANLWNSTIWTNVTFSVFPGLIKDFKIWDENAPYECNAEYEKPKIILKRTSSEDDYGYHYTTRGYSNGDDSIVEKKLASHIVTDADVFVQLSYEIDYTFITCMASYPVKLYFKDKEVYRYWYWRNNPEDIGTGNQPFNTNDTLHHCFRERFTLNNWSPEMTGEYRCQNLNDPNIYSTVYIYLTNTRSVPIINNGKNEVITLDTKELETYLPCRVNNPNTTVYLYSHKNKGKYNLLKKNDYISYSPKKGFLMATNSLSLSSLYVCTTSRNRSSRANSIYFTFKQPNKTDNKILPDVTLSTYTMPNEIKLSIFLVFFLFIAVVVLQLGFLKKQVTFHDEIKTIIGTNINMDPHSIATFADFENNSNTNVNANSSSQLVSH